MRLSSVKTYFLTVLFFVLIESSAIHFIPFGEISYNLPRWLLYPVLGGFLGYKGSSRKCAIGFILGIISGFPIAFFLSWFVFIKSPLHFLYTQNSSWNLPQYAMLYTFFGIALSLNIITFILMILAWFIAYNKKHRGKGTRNLFILFLCTLSVPNLPQ